MAEACEFYVRAITDYYGVAADELDLKEGAIYTIIQQTESGWWYAIDEDGIDGWVPSNYLDKCNETEQNELKEAHRIQAEEEAKKQAELAAAGVYDQHDDDDDYDDIDGDDPKDDNDRMKNELLKNAANYAKRMEAKRKAESDPADSKAQEEFKEHDQQRKAKKKAKAALDKQKYAKSKEEKERLKKEKEQGFTNKQWKSDNDMKNEENRKEMKWKKEKEEKLKARIKPKMFEEWTADEMKKFDNYRPVLKTIKLNPEMDLHSYAAKSYQTWSVDELLHYLVVNADSKNTFELKSIVGYLAKKAQITESIREDILQKNGLNIVLNLLSRGGDLDVAVSMSCCKAICVLCESPSASQYPSEQCAVFYLTTAIRNSFGNPIFCYTAFNCICNFTHNNDKHRSYIVSDEFNRSVIGYIIEGMNKFRFSENDITRNHHCEKVQISACLALQNLAANEEGRKLIGCDGVEAVLDGFIAHVENNLVISASLGTLINLCANVENALHFIENDGINYLLTYLQNPSDNCNNSDIKITTCRILRNIALEYVTATKLCQREEIDDVITSLLINADYGTELFFEVVKFVNALISTLNANIQNYKDKQNSKLNDLMTNLCERNLFNILVDALEMDYDIDLSNNAFITRINAQIAATMSSYVLSENLEIKSSIFSSADISNPDAFIPAKLIQASFVTPSPQLSYYTNNIFFNCMDQGKDIKNILIQVGLLDYLFNTTWYKDDDVNDNAIALGCGILLCLLQEWYIERQKYSINNPIVVDWDVAKYQQSIIQFNDFIKNNKLKTTKSQQLKATQPKLEQFVKAIPVLIKKYAHIS